jgi:hypothetical protein
VQAFWALQDICLQEITLYVVAAVHAVLWSCMFAASVRQLQNEAPCLTDGQCCCNSGCCGFPSHLVAAVVWPFSSVFSISLCLSPRSTEYRSCSFVPSLHAEVAHSACVPRLAIALCCTSSFVARIAMLALCACQSPRSAGSAA